MRFVLPETVRLTLPSGDWMVVKKELTVGEDHRYRSAGLHRISREGQAPTVDVNWAEIALARVETYLVDWSAKTADGKDVPVTRAAIEALDPDDFRVMDEAIQAHIAATAEEKKLRAPSSGPVSS